MGQEVVNRRESRDDDVLCLVLHAADLEEKKTLHVTALGKEL